jgi:hypothetical protein
MSSVASDIDPAGEAEPQVVVEESSSVGGGDGEGFCLYMEAGACKEAFVSWEQCRQAARTDGSDSAERCAEAIVNLRSCMHAHADYYGPVLKVDVSIQDEAAIAAATADTDNNKVEESSLSTDEVKKEEADAESESAASAAEAKIEEVEQAASSTTALEAKKEEAVVDKAESSSLGN